MSAQLYYTIPNTNQRSPNAMSYPDNRRRSPPQQGFGPGGINMYHQQQIQSALYQQQQIEFAQQQAQLEMHLQLEQMRLQNLALQEQIMIGQAHAHQAHAQAQAEQQQQQQLHNTFYSTNKAPAQGRMTFTQGQGGMLAERALARRQQAEADALYAQCYPNVEEEDDVLRELGHAPPYSSVGSDRSSNLTPPAVVVSKPDEAFPLLASADSPFAKTSGFPKLINQQAATDSQPRSFAATLSKGSVSPASSVDNSQAKDTSVAPTKKKFSDVLKSSAAKPPSQTSANATAAPAPKLNPFSSVFVPGSNSGPETEAAAPVTTASPPQKMVSFVEPTQDVAPVPGVYRAPRSQVATYQRQGQQSLFDPVDFYHPISSWWHAHPSTARSSCRSRAYQSELCDPHQKARHRSDQDSRNSTPDLAQPGLVCFSQQLPLLPTAANA
ncbi:hypothetical protein Pst134EA_026699 [Puccinia striiformis f. sp. tritici]|uniref:hypothetical protein n=1 Tax=Puccinia striiformis f. sp. tritici TaxID=168172 RepID=UPI00200763B9|nr:hypothetical protein Pst134EA_026699 [Puccinia striiformis f. sp. tritici]KAH9449987.1 hypothetical protein Pst134EA_026699 [Puccinia striiformis f. sp. tritici]